MGLYARCVVPPLLDLSMRHRLLREYRRQLVATAEGTVVEIGIGSGLNLAYYGSAVAVIIGIDPSEQLLRLADRRVADCARPVRLVQARAECLPLRSEMAETVVMSWALCSIREPLQALREMRRILRPGGTLRFVEHGRAPEPVVARWQDRLDPLWCRIAGGCHLNRPMDQLIRAGGFSLDRLEHSRLPGPRTHTYLYHGRALPV